MAFKAELLRKKLKEEGKKRADLAAATRRNVRTVSRWLTGENPPKTKDLEAISRVLNCRPQDFLKWSCFLGQVCGLSKMHQIYVHAAFRISACSKYAASGVRLSSA
ncbi:helix-turn-helix domain-containing protein, partial [Roseinatronobacter ekhonensis]|uniref:helix-turn-helix domain-containing protein n=1 Tax=Roseinatronobacter ekhonensis TaxID=254356 RepID=UPI001601EDD7